MTASEGDLIGDWMGIFRLAQRCTFIIIHVEPQGTVLTATLARPFDALPIQPLTPFTVDSTHVHFVLSQEPEPLRFSGIWQGMTISGQIRHNDEHGVFHLIRQVAIPAECYPAYAGAYQLAPGHIISIANQQSLLGRAHLMYTDCMTGDYRALFPISSTTFLAGSTILCPIPITITATFQMADDAGDVALTLSAPEQPHILRKIALRHEEVRFLSGDDTLAGVLTHPPGPGPHPAIVMIGYEPRDVYLDLALFFASSGIATLRYDRRGDGASEGDWGQMTFAMQADDALASVQFLQQHPAVHPTQIGLWWLSQTGWIAPLAASRSRNVAFIIPVSGPWVSVAQQELYRIGQWMRTDGRSEMEVAAAIAYMMRVYDVLRKGTGWEQLEPAVQQARQSGWAGYVILPSSLEEMQQGAHWQWIRRILDYDPVPALRQVQSPVLAIFGALDSVVPAEQSAAIWTQALQEGGNADTTITVLPNGNHGLWAASSGGMHEWPCLTGHVSDYYRIMIEWLRQRVTVAVERN